MTDIARLGISIDSTQVDRAARSLDDLARSGRAAEGSTTRLASSADVLASAARAAMGAMVALKSVDIVSQAIAAQREFDKLNASLVTATGSAANATSAFKAIQAFAATTPYSLKDATEAFIKMRNLGLDPSEKALRSYGNTAAAMGKGLTQMVEAVADAATGEFERLKEFGIQAEKNKDKVAITFQNVTKSIGNNSKEIEAYLQNLGNVNFSGAMELRAATLDGAISNLGDTWEDTMRRIAKQGISNATTTAVMALTGAMEDFGAILDSVTQSASEEGNAIQNAATIQAGMTRTLETVAVLGINVAYVLESIGKELGGLAAQAVAAARLDFEGARAIGVAMKADADKARKEVDARTEAILAASAKAREAYKNERDEKERTGRDDLARYKLLQGEKQEIDEKAAKAAKAEADAVQKYITQLRLEAAQLGMTAGQKKMSEAADYAATLSTTAHKEAVMDEVSALVESMEAYEDRVNAVKRSNDAFDEILKLQDAENEKIEKGIGSLRAKIESIEAETQALVLSGVELEKAIVLREMEKSGLEESSAAYIEMRKRLEDALSANTAGKAAKEAADEWKKTADKIESSLTDALMRGFESGKGFGENLRDTLENMFKTMVLRPIIQGVVQTGLSAVGLGGTAGTTGGGILGGVQTASSLYNTASTAMGYYEAFQTGTTIGAEAASTAAQAYYNAGNYATGWALKAGSLYGAPASTGLTTPALTSSFETGLGLQAGSIPGGASGAGLSASAADLIPVVGWVIAAYSLLDWYSGLGGGEKTAMAAIAENGKIGNSYTKGTGEVFTSAVAAGPQPAMKYPAGTVVNLDDMQYEIDYQAQSDWRGAVTAEKRDTEYFTKIVNPTIEAAVEMVNSLGGTIAGSLKAASEILIDSQGDAADIVFTGLTQSLADGTQKIILDSYSNGERGKTAETAQTEMARLTLATIAAASGLPPVFAEVIGSMNLASASAEKLNAAVAQMPGLKMLADGFEKLGWGSEHLTMKMIAAAGGQESLANLTSKYYETFYSEEEKKANVAAEVAKTTAALTKSFSDLGFSLPETKEGFRAIAEKLVDMGPSGEEALAKLLGMQDGFLSLHPVMDDVTTSTNEATQAAKDFAAAQLATSRSLADSIASARGAAQQNWALQDLAAMNKDWGNVQNLLTANPFEKTPDGKNAYSDEVQGLMRQAIDFWAGQQNKTNTSTDSYSPTDTPTAVDPAIAAKAWADFQKSISSSIEDFGLSDLQKQIKAINASYDDNILKSHELAKAAGVNAAALDAQIASLRDLQIAEAKKAADAALLNDKLALQAEIYKTTGDAAGAAAVLQQQHAIAMEALNPALRDLQTQLWAAQDAAQAAADAAKAAADAQKQLTDKLSLQAQIYKLTGNEAGAASVLEQQHAIALASIDPALRGLQIQLWGLEASSQAATSSLSKAQTTYDSAKSSLQEAYNEQAASITTLRDKFKDFAKSIKDFKTSLILSANSPLNGMQKYEAAKADYLGTSAKAKLGDTDAIERLQSVSQSFLDASRGSFASGDQYSADFADVIKTLDNTVSLSERQYNLQQDSLDALHMQIGTLLDVNTSVLSVTDAIAALHKTIIDLDAAKANAATSGTTGTAAPSSALFTTIASAGKGQIGSNTIEQMYGTILGRHSASMGLDYWTKEAQSENGYSLLLKFLAGAKASNPTDGANATAWAKQMGIPGFAKGGIAQGTFMAGENGPELIQSPYPLRVLPTGTQASNQSTEDLVKEIKLLREEVASLRKDQQGQHRESVISNYDANDRAAQKITKAQQDSDWKAAIKPRMAA